VREKFCLKVYIGGWEGKRKSVGGVRGLCRPEAEVGLGARRTMGGQVKVEVEIQVDDVRVCVAR
jgi:hypothetical protein